MANNSGRERTPVQRLASVQPGNRDVNQRILITGGSGFLGHGLTRALLANGDDVRIYSRNEHAQYKMRTHFADAERLAFFIGDVLDSERLERAMQRCDAVVHAAALKRIEVGAYNPDQMVAVNVTGTTKVIEAARRARVRRVVFVSSDKAFEPVSPYGLSKALAEHLCLAANSMSIGPRFVVCRYGNVAGSTGSVIPIWRALIERGEEITMTDPEATRFWMRLDEAVGLVLSALHGDKELLIPALPAYRLYDLARAMGAERIRVTQLQSFEKKHESMGAGNSSECARRMTVAEIAEELTRV